MKYVIQISIEIVTAPLLQYEKKKKGYVVWLNGERYITFTNNFEILLANLSVEFTIRTKDNM